MFMEKATQITVDTTASLKARFKTQCILRDTSMVEMVNLLAQAWMEDPDIIVPFPERIRRAGLSPHPENHSKANVSGNLVPNPEQKNSLVSDELRAIESSVQELPREIRQKVIDLVGALVNAFGTIPEDDLALRIIEGAIRATKEEHEKGPALPTDRPAGDDES